MASKTQYSEAREFTHIRGIVGEPPTLHQPAYLTRRNADGTHFLARGFPVPASARNVPGVPDPMPNDRSPPEDAHNTVQHALPFAQEAMFGVLNHPNLVNLVTIVNPEEPKSMTNPDPAQIGYTVWENCANGTLETFIRAQKGKANAEAAKKRAGEDGTPDKGIWTDLDEYDLPPINEPSDWDGRTPESLCWHILVSISQALLWLHQGVKKTPGTDDEWFLHDQDWQPILTRSVTPANVFFAEVLEGETYGACKLGGFRKCKVLFGNVGPGQGGPDFCAAPGKNQVVGNETDYWAPEVWHKEELWRAKSEVWMLASIVFELMTGKPASRDKEAAELRGEMTMGDRSYSEELVSLVANMLERNRWRRFGVRDVVQQATLGQEIWRENTKEGRWYVDINDIERPNAVQVKKWKKAKEREQRYLEEDRKKAEQQKALGFRNTSTYLLEGKPQKVDRSKMAGIQGMDSEPNLFSELLRERERGGS